MCGDSLAVIVAPLSWALSSSRMAALISLSEEARRNLSSIGQPRHGGELPFESYPQQTCCRWFHLPTNDRHSPDRSRGPGLVCPQPIGVFAIWFKMLLPFLQAKRLIGSESGNLSMLRRAQTELSARERCLLLGERAPASH